MAVAYYRDPSTGNPVALLGGGGGGITAAGAGLTLTGSTVDFVAGDSSLTVAADSVVVASAPKWTTTRTITLTGDVTSAATNIDGSGNVSIATTAVAGGGGIVRSVNSISGATTAGATAKTDYVYLCTAALTLTLPTAVGNTNLYTIKRTGTGNITVATTASQTIDGVTTFTLDLQYQSIQVVSNNANWSIVAASNPITRYVATSGNSTITGNLTITGTMQAATITEA